MATNAKAVTEEKKIKSTDYYLKEKVECVLRKPEDTDEEFATVTVNGVNYQIQYGKVVFVPRFVKEVIENSYKAGEEAQHRQTELVRVFEGGKEALL